MKPGINVRALFLTIFLLLLSGCVTGELVRNIEPGMSQDEVEKVLGKPDRTKHSGDETIYKYSNRQMSGWSWNRADYWFIFNNDRLIKYETSDVSIVLEDVPFAMKDDQRVPMIRNVALVTDSSPPSIEEVKLGITHGEGAAQGALDGAADSLQVLQGCSGETCGIGLLLLPVFAVGGAIAGGVSGAIAGHSSETLTDAESKARQLLDTAFLQTELLTRAENYGKANLDMNFLRLPPGDTQMLLETPDNKTFSDNSIDVVLELNLLRISLAYSLDLYAQARLISVKTGEVLSDDKYTYTSAPHDLEEWIRDGAEPLSAVIEMGLETIAENAIDDNFLLFYPSNPSAFKYDPSSSASEQKRTLRGGRIPHYVLSPLYTRLRADVDSIHPTLRWEAFPREYDLIDADGQRHRITDVHYDLRVFDTDRDSYALRSNTGPRAKTHLVPGQLVYEARAISEPYHKIANGLNACTEYFWTVRARFRRDEHTRATEWAAQSSGDLWRPAWELRHNTRTSVTPGWYYYRFSTPCEPSPPSPGLPNKKTAIHRHR